MYSMIDDLGERVDRSEGRLNTAMKRITDILRKEEGKQTEYKEKTTHPYFFFFE